MRRKMIRTMGVGAVALAIVGCTTREEAMRDDLQKHPDVVFQLIENNPEAFMASVEKAAMKARDARAENERRAMAEQMEKDLREPKKPALSEARRLSGAADASVTIVEYGDFQCPACAMGHRTMKALQAKYGDRVQIHFRNMPLDFHPQAMLAARVFESVKSLKPSKAAAVHDFLFENQDALKAPDFVARVAKQAGLTAEALKKKAESAEIESLVRSDMGEFENFVFTGTPVWIVNGVAMAGAQPLDAVEKVIERSARPR